MKPVLTLTFIGFCSALLLSMVNELTKVYIEQAQANLKIEALAETFPFEIKNVNTIKEKDTAYYEIKDANNALLGVGVETFTEKGYGGKVSILLALSPECTIFDYKVLSHQETPGLGDKITNEFFKKQFRGKTLNNTDWKVKKDGGFVDELTAATISSRAVTAAIYEGLAKFSEKYQGRCR